MKCKYLKLCYNGKKICTHKANPDIRGAKAGKHRRIKEKRCSEEFCPLI